MEGKDNMAQTATAPEGTTADDMLEALVLQNEEKLDAIAEAYKAKGSPEGPKHPVTIRQTDGTVETIVDRSDAEKAQISVEAVNRRADDYNQPAGDEFIEAKPKKGTK
jgi:hypothetical protein